MHDVAKYSLEVRNNHVFYSGGKPYAFFTSYSRFIGLHSSTADFLLMCPNDITSSGLRCSPYVNLGSQGCRPILAYTTELLQGPLPKENLLRLRALVRIMHEVVTKYGTVRCLGAVSRTPARSGCGVVLDGPVRLMDRTVDEERKSNFAVKGDSQIRAY